jgi:nitrite reductase/ring-hydroxylating ferredoxin subunit
MAKCWLLLLNAKFLLRGMSMFQPLAKLIDLHDGFRQTVAVNGKSYLLLQTQGQLWCIENRCPHMDAPLANAQISDGAIRCRAHGIAFDLATGKAQGPLADTIDCLVQLPLIYDGDRVGVEL